MRLLARDSILQRPSIPIHQFASSIHEAFHLLLPPEMLDTEHVDAQDQPFFSRGDGNIGWSSYKLSLGYGIRCVSTLCS